MDRVKWGELSARERDALVAEHVMGGEEAHPEHYWFRNIIVDGIPDMPKTKGIDPLFSGPYYSTDIAAAWVAAEKIATYDPNRDHPWLAVSVVAAQPGQYGCLVYACPPGHTIWDAEEVVARSVRSEAPDAVCIACLRARGVEVED